MTNWDREMVWSNPYNGLFFILLALAWRAARAGVPACIGSERARTRRSRPSGGGTRNSGADSAQPDAHSGNQADRRAARRDLPARRIAKHEPGNTPQLVPNPGLT